MEKRFLFQPGAKSWQVRLHSSSESSAKIVTLLRRGPFTTSQGLEILLGEHKIASKQTSWSFCEEISHLNDAIATSGSGTELSRTHGPRVLRIPFDHNNIDFFPSTFTIDASVGEALRALDI